MKKLTLTKAAAAVTAFAAALTAVTAVPAEMSAKADDFPALMTAEEAAAWTEMLGRFGFDSVQELLSDSRALPNVSRIKDLDGNGAANVLDAQYILQFLSGRRMYGYDYSELDVTNDFVLNSADSQAYLQYAAYYMVQELNAPFSAHGASVTPDSSYEYRTYVKHLYSNGYTTANDTTYPLNASVNAPDDQETVNQHISSASSTYDTRAVINAGSGFVNGSHTIVTAAHCVYTIDSGLYSSAAIKMTTYNNGVPTQTTLTPVSVHIPLAYYFTTESNRHLYDYAVVEVEEDLSSYGSFECGMVLKDNANSSPPALSTMLVGFPSEPEYYYNFGNNNIDRGYPASFAGVLTYLDDYNVRTTSLHFGSMSGGVHYTTVTYSGSSKAVAFGIHTSGSVINSTGTAITRPLLQFFYNNPNLP